MATKVGLLDESMKKLKFMCTVLGLDLENRKNNYKQMFIYFFNSFWMNRDVVGAIWFIVDGIIYGKDFLMITHGAPCATISILGNLKSLAIIFNGDKLQNIFEILKDLEKKHIDGEDKHIDGKEKNTVGEEKRIVGKEKRIDERDIYIEGEKNDKKEQIVQEDVTFLHNLIRALNISYIVLLIAFAVNPIAVTLYHYWKTGEVVLGLPFFVKYPFDSFDLRYWPWVYLHQIWAEIIVIGYVCVVDYIFYICCTYLRTQFRLLELELEYSITLEMTKEEFRAKFRDIVQWHQELINCVHMLEEIFAKSTLYNFVSSSILICLTGFDVLMNSDIIMVMSFVFFLFANLFQIFFFCFFGDLLMRSSVDVGNGPYKSLWYMKDASYGKALLLIQIRSQKACKLTAYSFADVNLMAFTKILSNAWSYFALLNTMLT